MKNLESKFKTKLIDQVKELDGYGRRLEEEWAVGVLDMVIILPGYELVFAEGKLIRGNMFKPTERQWVEGTRIIAACLENLSVARPVLIGWTEDGTMYLSEWVREADIRTAYKQLNELNYAETLMEWLYVQQQKHCN